MKETLVVESSQNKSQNSRRKFLSPEENKHKLETFIFFSRSLQNQILPCLQQRWKATESDAHFTAKKTTFRCVCELAIAYRMRDSD
jgi:hypothetical protein